MEIETAYTILYSAALLVLGVLIGIMLIRAVIGPRITDRILAINMIGTMVISCILILSLMLKENYLADVAMIYAMISFITVLMMATTYIPKDPTRPLAGPEAVAEAEHEKEQLRAEEADAEAAASSVAAAAATAQTAEAVVSAAAAAAADSAAGNAVGTAAAADSAARASHGDKDKGAEE